MKKVLAILTAAAAVLSLNVSAFAATNIPERNFYLLSGDPINEDGKQIDMNGSVASNQKIYFAIPDSAAKILNDSKISKLTVKKNTNGKIVKSVNLVEKKLGTSSDNYWFPNGNSAVNSGVTKYTGDKRKSYLEVVLNEVTGTDEYKVELTATFSMKKANNGFYYGLGSGTDLTVFQGPMVSGDKLPLKLSFYVANPKEDGDGANVSVGSSGATIKPVKNTENEIVFEGADTYATLTFTANSNPDKFYAKMTTKWPAGVSSKFSDTDAVVRSFASASISATSRATLALNNPYDLDDYDPEDIYLYTVDSKGKLTDITNSVTYNDDDDTFELKTRTLTTYIISNQEVSTK